MSESVNNVTKLDMGGLSIEPDGNDFLVFTIYGDEEFTIDDIQPIYGYFEQFHSKVPVMVQRKGHYSMTYEVQMVLAKEVKRRCSAVAYIDATPIQKILTNYAALNYMSGINMKAFSTREEAAEWLCGYGGLNIGVALD